jgi:formamidopyrimidine-DNA glycosylase
VRFVDQRMFGGRTLSPGGAGLPREVAHIALDLFDPGFDLAATARRIAAKNTVIKRALLDQTVVSGIGNIYADEALWLARTHYATPTRGMPPARIRRVLSAAREVMAEAIAAGGTSFDALYVGVDGAGGYFARRLNVYGREGLPCPRCGSPIRREPFMGRSSFLCRKCQRIPGKTR